MSKMKCPACKGSGAIEAPGSAKRSDRVVVAAKLLNKAGYSLREISAMLGYKSSRSAATLIRKPQPLDPNE